MPKLTVVMPVYNGEKYLKYAIESVLNQSFTDYEFLIIDDKSRDTSPDIISSYKDKRIRFVRNEENLGQMQTLNVGIGLSRGEYIARMDHDDTSLKERFKKEVEVLTEDGDAGFVYSDSFIIDEDGKRREKTLFDFTKPPRIFALNEFLKRNYIAGNTVMMKKDVFETIGLFNPRYKIAAEYDLFLRIAQKYKIYCIDEPLAEYRVHGANASKNLERNLTEAIEILANFRQNSKDKVPAAAVDKAISWYKASLGMCYLFRYERELCKSEEAGALKLNHFNTKAIAAIFMAKFFPRRLVARASSFRKEMLE